MGVHIPYEKYFDHALKLNELELDIQKRLLRELPSTIIDSHVHVSTSEHYSPEDMSDRVLGHMMSTFPVNDLETSALIDEHLMPGIEVRKIRFANAYAGIGHFAVTNYLIDNSPVKDAVVCFGLSETEEQVEDTIEFLRNPRISGLKMYYLATNVEKSKIYDYFPKPILEVAQEEAKPIILHLPHSLYNSKNEVLDIAERYPNLDIILAHMGVVHIPRKELGMILDLFAKHDNIYADTSQVHDSRVISAGIKHLGVDKLLYGSDEPLNLIRSVIYDNPTLGPRILTDYPYHWVDPEEYAENIQTIKIPFVHSEWQQLQAIFDGMKLSGINNTAQATVAKDKIFHDNAAHVFNL